MKGTLQENYKRLKDPSGFLKEDYAENDDMSGNYEVRDMSGNKIYADIQKDEYAAFRSESGEELYSTVGSEQEADIFFQQLQSIKDESDQPMSWDEAVGNWVVMYLK